jgi:hypothetical protein
VVTFRIMRRLFCVAAVLALAACGGGGGSTPTVASDAPVLFVPGTSNVVSNPLPFTSGTSVQFEPQESGYQGSFTIQAMSGTSGASCITTGPATIANGSVFTSSTTSGGCSSYPQSETYDVSDSNGHASTITIQINAP